MSESKTISSKYVMQRAMANHTIDNSAWFNDAIDWTGQAMRFIGKHAGFPVKMCTDVYVEDYNTCMPLDTEGLIAIMYKGTLLPLGSDLSGMDYLRKSTAKALSQDLVANQELLVKINGLEQQQKELVELYAVTPTQEIADKINEVSASINSLTSYVSAMNQYQVGRSSSIGEFYNIKQDSIQTSFEKGYIDIIYTAFPLDSEGFPLVIDNEFYIQAIEWYYILILIQKGYKHPLFTWQDAKNEFWGNPKTGEAGWRAKAANNVRIPSLQDAERFTRMWEQARFRRDLPLQLFNRTEQLTGTIY